MNDLGQVIGITSSKLSSRSASSVGLAVPVERLHQMLKSTGIQWNKKPTPQPMTGPEIARAVKSGVAFIRTSGFQGKVFDMNFEFSDRHGSSRPRISVPFAHFIPPNQNKAEMKINEFGEIMEQTGDPGTLPFLLGPLNQYCLLPLDYLGRSKWNIERNLMLHAACPSRSERSVFRSLPTSPTQYVRVPPTPEDQADPSRRNSQLRTTGRIRRHHDCASHISTCNARR